MAYQIVEIGASPNDGTGDPARTAFTKINANFALTDTNIAGISTTVAGKVGAASPAFTGTPVAPTAPPGTNTTQISTTAFVTGALGSYLTAAVATATYAPLASPALTGTPTAPNPSSSDNTNRIATTSMVQAAISATPASTPTGSMTSLTYAEYATNADITAIIPLDDTIPQVTEGSQVFSQTAAASTATERINIRFRSQVACSISAWVSCALFIDGAANAVRAATVFIDTGSGGRELTLEYEYVPGNTTTHTYSIRVGPSAASTVRLNGSPTARLFGGASAATFKIIRVKG